MTPHIPASAELADRLDYLRGEIRAERISYGELAELADLAPYIAPGDVELLQWAGVPEFPDCHPDCGPIVLRNDGEGNHAHENIDGRCWHENEDGYTPGPMA